MKLITIGGKYQFLKACKVKGNEYKAGDKITTMFHGQLFVIREGDIEQVGHDFPNKKFSKMLNEGSIVEI